MKKIVAVTACPTGIAHTFMAAESLENAAKEKGYEIKVETQGQGETENHLSQEEINNADAIILAVDIGIDLKRFRGKKVLEVPVASAIKDPNKIIEDAINGIGLKKIEGSKEENEGSSNNVKSAYNHLMNGVSRMLPIVVAGGLLIALSFAFDLNPTEGSFAWVLSQIGGAALGIMVPILSAFIASSIADRAGFTAGLVGGIISNNIGAGFLGGMLSGFLAGYIVLAINKYIKVPKTLQGLKQILITPLLSTLIIGLLMYYVIGTPISKLTEVVSNFLASLTGANLVILGIIFGLLYIDLGGPLSKILYAFVIGLVSEGITEPMAAVMICGMIPPIGVAFSRFIKPSIWSNEEKEGANVALILGASYITEGAIPFATAYPTVVLPATVIGGMVGATMSLLLGVGTPAPHGGLFLLLIPNAINKPLAFILSLIVGSFVTALIIIALKTRRDKKVAE